MNKYERSLSRPRSEISDASVDNLSTGFSQNLGKMNQSTKSGKL